ncbi:MAG TPA: hypothetical protein VI895_08485 [Bdellovibrionota bacterium]|nr:hypothetical protein [Bdellovibrionota bacterium]
MTKTATKSRTRRPGDDRLYVLYVFLTDGPMTAAFLRRNRVVSRMIEIKGDQTLEQLHYAIFDAFGREDEHMYEFQIGGTGPTDSKARRYVLRSSLKEEPGASWDVSAFVGSLGLKVGDAFGYWFDFGDNWRHQINVVEIQDVPARGKFPKISDREGDNPPQYVNWDEVAEFEAPRRRA